MKFKRGLKIAACCVVWIGYTAGHWIVSEAIGELIGEKLTAWVDS